MLKKIKIGEWCKNILRICIDYKKVDKDIGNYHLLIETSLQCEAGLLAEKTGLEAMAFF